MLDWIRVRCFRSLSPRAARLLVSTTGILLLAVTLGSSALPSALARDHGSQVTHCAACHGAPPDGNEEDALASEGLYLIDNQPPISLLESH